jgi:hypothetical protein
MKEVRVLVAREARATMASAVLQSTVSDLELLSEVKKNGKFWENSKMII